MAYGGKLTFEFPSIFSLFFSITWYIDSPTPLHFSNHSILLNFSDKISTRYCDIPFFLIKADSCKIPERQGVYAWGFCQSFTEEEAILSLPHTIYSPYPHVDEFNIFCRCSLIKQKSLVNLLLFRY